MRDELSRRALRFVLEQAGFEVVGTSGPRVVSDSVQRGSVVDVLVTAPTADALTAAVRHVTSGHVRSVVRLDRPDDLPVALDLLDRGLFVLPAAVEDAIAAMPSVGERDRAMWEAVMAGQSDRSMAQALQLSPTTVKRAVTVLRGAVDAATRVELVAAGYRLGLEPRRLRP